MVAKLVTGDGVKDERRAIERARSNEGLSKSFHDVSAALARERERSQSLAAELDIMREYAPMDLHEYTAMRLMAEAFKKERFKKERFELRAQIYERDEEIKKLKSESRFSVGGTDAANP